MLVGESLVTPNSRRIPCNQTHYVATLSAALYSGSFQEREMVCCFLLDQQIGPSEIIKTKYEVDFLLVGSPAQFE